LTWGPFKRPVYDGEQLVPAPTRIDSAMRQHPKTGDAFIGINPQRSEAIVAANGNLDLL
jgi:hypothetical protein